MHFLRITFLCVRKVIALITVNGNVEFMQFYQIRIFINNFLGGIVWKNKDLS